MFHIQILQYPVAGYIAEQGYLIPQSLIKRMFAAADDDVRLNPHALQFLDAGLGRLGLHFLGSTQIRDQGHMDQDRIVAAHFMLELTDGLQERLALDIAHRAAHLDNGDSGILISEIAVEAALDLIRDMGNHLYRAAAVIAAALFLQYGPVDLASSHVGVLAQILVNETLIMTKIQIGLRAVLRDEHFAVLDGIHRAGIDIDIGVKFLHRDFVAPRFQ